jgi:hypothetical protein
MRPVAPRIGAPELTLAEEQHDYLPITAAVLQGPHGVEVVTRWQLTPEDRARLLAGEDLYIRLLTFGQPMQPLAPAIGWAP